MTATTMGVMAHKGGGEGDVNSLAALFDRIAIPTGALAELQKTLPDPVVRLQDGYSCPSAFSACKCAFQ